MGRAAASIELTAVERRGLESLSRARKTGQAMARRARIVLAAAAGLENKAICAEVGADANTVSKWRRRFAAHRLEGLLDEPRPGTPRKIGDDNVAETIRLTLETTPSGATHWSLRAMAKAVGYARVWLARVRGLIFSSACAACHIACGTMAACSSRRCATSSVST